jgi:hypothetical protein
LGMVDCNKVYGRVRECERVCESVRECARERKRAEEKVRIEVNEKGGGNETIALESKTANLSRKKDWRTSVWVREG